MEPEIFEGIYVSLEDPDTGGTTFLPEEDWDAREYASQLMERFQRDMERAQNHPEHRIRSARGEFEIHHGFLARLSAPGYLDCTDWIPCDSEEDARAELREAYGPDEEVTPAERDAMERAFATPEEGEAT